jgi:hypothetical protein
MLPVALRGFHTARQRYRDHLHSSASPSEEALVISTVEVIYWACTLDEQLEHRDTWYGQSSDYGRSVLRGVRYARNRATHQLPMLLERRAGFQAPVEAPIRSFEFVWLPIDRLPEPGRPPGNGQRENYELHLAGKPVRNTINSIADWFAAEQNRVGSPIAVGSW